MGLLSLSPMSGYEIRKLIDESIGEFWTESFGQIYPTLKRLATAEMVTVKVEREEGRAERKVYTLTLKGEQRLREWLHVPAQEQVPRNELLLKIFFGRLIPVEGIMDQVKSFRAVLEGRIERYAGTAERLKQQYPQHPDLPFWLMTTSFGLHEARALRDWCDETLKSCRALQKK